LIAFGGSLASYAWDTGKSRRAGASGAGLLPAAMAKPVDVVVKDTLKAGETLSQLLERAELAEAEANALLLALEEHQDPRRMQPGSVVAFSRSLENGDVRKMELRLDADRTLSMS